MFTLYWYHLQLVVYVHVCIYIIMSDAVCILYSISGIIKSHHISVLIFTSVAKFWTINILGLSAALDPFF